ncbi:conserved hypothetical protein [Syntrophobacter sp. SbD1]|nr:conserved hypothetical protein [Syntrophobacter sp. SbD1]
MVFFFDALNLEGRIMDTNILALKAGTAPMSLGMRPQVLKLRYVAPGIAGNFLKPQFPFRKHVNCGLENDSSPINRVSTKIKSSFICETESLIYSPVSVRGNVLFDAILQSPVGRAGEIPLELGAERCDDEDQLSFLPMVCPGCGWDLEGEKNSLVHLCRHCTTVWQSNGSSFESVKFAFPAAKNGANTGVYLPFWRLDASVTGLQLRSYADLMRLANLPKVIQNVWEQQKPYFWVPAFKVHPDLFLRLLKSLTTLQPEPESDTPQPKSGILPVTIPAGEALESLKVLLASLVVPKKFIFPLLPALSFSMNDRMLVYLRFSPRGQELIHEDLNISIQAGAVSWGQLI